MFAKNAKNRVAVVSAVAAFLGAGASGCDSSGGEGAAGDAGSDVTTPDAMTMNTGADATTSEASEDAGDAGIPDSAACTPLDASVETVALGPHWGCFQSMCTSELAACAADCLCNDAIFGGLACVRDGGAETACLTAAIAPNLRDSVVVIAGHCITTNLVGCRGGMDARTEDADDAATEAGSADAGEAGNTEAGEAGSTEAGEAGSTEAGEAGSTEAGEAGSTDAATDGGATD